MRQPAKPLAGKTISILGDSISTFDGWIPAGHRPRYPDPGNPRCDVRDVKLTYWMRLIHAQGARLGVNDSWAGSCVGNVWEADEGDIGPGRAMASMGRIKSLGANGTPDVILFFGGGNDYNHREIYPLGCFDAAAAPDAAELDAVRWDSVVEAYTAAILRMKAVYPAAKIVAILPIASRITEIRAYDEQFRAICRHYGVTCVELTRVEAGMLYDGFHPNNHAMELMAEDIAKALK